MKTDIINKNSGKFIEKLSPETIFEWNYIDCAPPVVSSIGNSGDGVMADGDHGSVLFPGKNGELYPSTMCYIGAFTAAGTTPNVDGTVPSVDTNNTAAGWNMQMDAETADNTGLELVLGGSQFGSNSNKIVAGTHAAVIDMTIYNADWTDFDAAVIGIRKAQGFETGHGGILAAASGDPAYTDFVAFGCQSADDVQIASALNDGSRTYTDSTQATAADKNHRFQITLAADGSVTFAHVGAAVAGEGALAAPTVTAAYTFDSGDVLVPYMLVQGTNQNSAIYLKDIKVTRTPVVDGHSVS